MFQRSTRCVFALILGLLSIGLVSAQSLPISELLRDSGKYINGSVTVRGIVAEKGESPDVLRAKYKIVLREGSSSIAIFSDGSFESLPEVGKPFTAAGILKTEGNELYILTTSGFNWLYLVLISLGLIAGGLVWALVRKPAAKQIANSTAQPTVSGLKVPCVSPTCRQMISPTDIFCEFCGQDQSKPVKAASLVAAPIKPTVSSVQAMSPDRTIMEPGADSTMVEIAAAKLVALEGPAMDRNWAIPGGETTIGREASNRIQLEGANVSKQHAVIRVEGDAVVVEDLNSTNGTYVNGQRITKRPLESGDKLKVGSHVISFTKTGQGN